MFGQTLISVFIQAAAPQRAVLIALAGALPLSVVASALAFRAGANNGPWLRLLSGLRSAGPSIGLLTGAMNSFHMAQTIQRVAFAPTARQLAPGILEVSTLIGLGALVGLVATTAQLTLSLCDGPNRSVR